MPQPNDAYNNLSGAIFNWLSTESYKIKAVIETGAQWEIWLQVEMAMFLKAICTQVGRELKYDDGRKSLDLMVRYRNEVFAIELKTESAMTGLVSGKSMQGALLSDIDKFETFGLQNSTNLYSGNNFNQNDPHCVSIGIGQTFKYDVVASKLYGVQFKDYYVSSVNFVNYLGVYAIYVVT